jgi:hypothetical protein
MARFGAETSRSSPSTGIALFEAEWYNPFMNDDDDPITITLRCRVKDCGYQKTYLPENPSDLLPVLEHEGWRFAQRGHKSLPVCPKHYK